MGGADEPETRWPRLEADNEESTCRLEVSLASAVCLFKTPGDWPQRTGPNVVFRPLIMLFLGSPSGKTGRQGRAEAGDWDKWTK